MLKILDLRPSNESTFVVVKDENMKDRLYGSSRGGVEQSGEEDGEKKKKNIWIF